MQIESISGKQWGKSLTIMNKMFILHETYLRAAYIHFRGHFVLRVVW